MVHRIWYPQLDPFDCIRRMLAILSFANDEGLSMERAQMADLFLSSPPLLHSVTMTMQIRSNFRELGIARPEKSFLSYPAAPLLFHKIEPVQRRAIRAMVGKNLIDLNLYEKRALSLTDDGRSLFDKRLKHSVAELKLAQFIVSDILTIGENNIEELRKRTGLRRLAV
tara:strand:- start:1376 stop:1879 length:504 start_codon:yes stop_codon:yes gene_type:complete